MSSNLEAYWRKNIILSAILLSIWAVVSYGFGILLVQTLNKISLGGFPLGFWFAQQGAIFVFVCLIFVYCFIMRKVDLAHDVDE